MPDVKLNITLHKNQMHIHQNAKLYSATKAGKRFGKSKLAIYRMIQKAGTLPDGVIWYIAPFFRMAKQIAWFDIQRMLPPQLIRRKIETDLFIELYNGCRIQLLGADHEDSLRGPKIDHLVMDEAAYCREHIWESILRGQLLGPSGSGSAEFISSPNRTGRNWFTAFHEEAMKKMLAGDPDWSAFYYTIWDNPTLPKEEIKKLEEATPEDTWRLEYLAIESDFAGQKYNEFAYERHVSNFVQPKEKLPTYRALDYGIQHPTVCLWAKVDRANGIVYIYDEFVKSGLIIEEICKVIHEKTATTPIEWSVIDPSSNRRDMITGRSLKDEFLKQGVGCVDGDRRGADEKGGRGVDIVKMFFKKGMIRIDPKCKTLIYELRNLQWGDKNGDDATDALRYLLVRLHDLVFNGILHNTATESFELKPKHTFNLNDPILFPKRQMENVSSIREELNAY